MEFMTDNKVLPFFRNAFMRDMTANYSGENEVSLPISDTDIAYVYLCIFNNNGTWEPVDIAPVLRGKATFNDIEPDIVFQLIHIEKGEKK